MSCEKEQSIWTSLTQLVPTSEKDIHQMLDLLQQTNTDVASVRTGLMSIFDHLADTIKPKPLWAEKAWAILDQTTQGDK